MRVAKVDCLSKFAFSFLFLFQVDAASLEIYVSYRQVMKRIPPPPPSREAFAASLRASPEDVLNAMACGAHSAVQQLGAGVCTPGNLEGAANSNMSNSPTLGVHTAHPQSQQSTLFHPGGGLHTARQQAFRRRRFSPSSSVVSSAAPSQLFAADLRSSRAPSGGEEEEEEVGDEKKSFLEGELQRYRRSQQFLAGSPEEVARRRRVWIRLLRYAPLTSLDVLRSRQVRPRRQDEGHTLLLLLLGRRLGLFFLLFFFIRHGPEENVHSCRQSWSSSSPSWLGCVHPSCWECRGEHEKGRTKKDPDGSGSLSGPVSPQPR